MDFITASVVLLLATLLAITAVTGMLRLVFFAMSRGVPLVAQGAPAHDAGVASHT